MHVFLEILSLLIVLSHRSLTIYCPIQVRANPCPACLSVVYITDGLPEPRSSVPPCAPVSVEKHWLGQPQSTAVASQTQANSSTHPHSNQIIYRVTYHNTHRIFFPYSEFYDFLTEDSVWQECVKWQILLHFVKNFRALEWIALLSTDWPTDKQHSVSLIQRISNNDWFWKNILLKRLIIRLSRLFLYNQKLVFSPLHYNANLSN